MRVSSQGRVAIRLTLAMALLSGPASARASTFYVHQGGMGDFVTIQEGVNAASAGDTVLVAAGTYVERLYVGPSADGVCLISESGPQATVIDGEDTTGPPLLLLEDVGSQTIVHGFSFVRGRASYWGAGISCENASAEITGNMVRDNLGTYPGYGGGIGVHSGSPRIADNHFEGNQSADGGAINVWYGSALIENNTFFDNEGWGFGGINAGGGIHVVYSSPTISRNRFEENYASVGGAIFVEGGPGVVISDNVFMANGASSHGGAVDARSDGHVEISQNVFSSNYTHMGNGRGAALFMSSYGGAGTFTITDNVFHGNLDASSTATISAGAPPHIHSNFFSNSTTYEMEVWNRVAPDTIDATGNWWGTSDSSGVAARIWDCADDSGLSCILAEPWCVDITCSGLATGVLEEQPVTWSRLKALYRRQ